MKEIIFDLLSVGKPAKAFSLNPEVKRADTVAFSRGSRPVSPGHVAGMSIHVCIRSPQSVRTDRQVGALLEEF